GGGAREELLHQLERLRGPVGHQAVAHRTQPGPRHVLRSSMLRSSGRTGLLKAGRGLRSEPAGSPSLMTEDRPVAHRRAIAFAIAVAICIVLLFPPRSAVRTSPASSDRSTASETASAAACSPR